MARLDIGTSVYFYSKHFNLAYHADGIQIETDGWIMFVHNDGTVNTINYRVS